MKLPFDPYLLVFRTFEQLVASSFLKLLMIGLGGFLLILLLAWVRRHIFQISMRGALFGFFLGMIVVLLLDLIIIIGLADKRKLQEILVPEKRQQALGEAVVSGVSNLNQALGVSTLVNPQKPQTAQEVLNKLLLLPPQESQKVKNLFCPE